MGDGWVAFPTSSHGERIPLRGGNLRNALHHPQADGHQAAKPSKVIWSE